MLVIPAYAKVNLCLVVRGRRQDGHHDIDSVAATIDWHDLVGIVATRATTTAVRLRVTGPTAADVPSDATNLAARAAAAVAELAGPLAVELWIHKRIPARAGLGGGSADAAAVLRGLAAILRSEPAGERPPAPDGRALDRLAASIGSDVPLLMSGGVRRMQGRGELLTAVPTAAAHLVLVIAGASGTAAAYAAVRASDHEQSARVERVVAALQLGVVPNSADLGSGLEGPARRSHPLLGERLAALRDAFPEVRWHLTGSGGAAFALVEDAAQAEHLAARARSAEFVARACRTVMG